LRDLFVARKDLCHRFHLAKVFLRRFVSPNGKQAGGVGCGGSERGLANPQRPANRMSAKASIEEGRSSAVTFFHIHKQHARPRGKAVPGSLRRAKLCRKLVCTFGR